MIELLKSCSHATAWSRCVGPQTGKPHCRWNRVIAVLGLLRALFRHVRRFWSFTKILEDGRMMRMACNACTWNKPASTISTALIFKILLFVIYLFIMFTISSSSVNMFQNPSGCCCLWSGKAWMKHTKGSNFSQSWPVMLKYLEAKNTHVDWNWLIWSTFTIYS